MADSVNRFGRRLSADEVKKLAEEHYGKLTNTFDVATRIRTEEPEPLAPRRVTLTDARAASPVIQRTYLTVSYATAQKGEAEALDDATRRSVRAQHRRLESIETKLIEAKRDHPPGAFGRVAVVPERRRDCVAEDAEADILGALLV